MAGRINLLGMINAARSSFREANKNKSEDISGIGMMLKHRDKFNGARDGNFLRKLKKIS